MKRRIVNVTAVYWTWENARKGYQESETSYRAWAVDEDGQLWCRELGDEGAKWWLSIDKEELELGREEEKK